MWYVLLTVSRREGGAAIHELGPFPQMDYAEAVRDRWLRITQGDLSGMVFTKDHVEPDPEPPISDPNMP